MMDEDKMTILQELISQMNPVTLLIGGPLVVFVVYFILDFLYRYIMMNN